MTFLCLARAPGDRVEVRVLHRMMRYFELPGGGGGGVADLSMGTLGDVRTEQIPVVEIDSSHFALIAGAGVRVPTNAMVPDQLAAAPPGTFLGPYGVDVPGPEVVQPRVIQVIPTKYAALLVHRNGVSPEIAYQELQGAFEADGVVDACADVIAWICVACTARGGGGDLAGISAVAHSFHLLLLPAAISDYVAAKVASDRPGRGPQGPAVGIAMAAQALDPMVAAVQQLAENVGGAGGRVPANPKG